MNTYKHDAFPGGMPPSLSESLVAYTDALSFLQQQCVTGLAG